MATLLEQDIINLFDKFAEELKEYLLDKSN